VSVPLTTAASLPQEAVDPVPESVRTLFSGTSCPGCRGRFQPRRPNQRHCTAACRTLAQRNADDARRAAMLDRLDPLDPGRAE